MDVKYILEIRDLPDELTEELLAKDIDETLGLVENSSAENDPEVEESMNEYSGTEYIEDIIPVKLRMLDAKEYTSTVSERFPGVKFIINLENNKICISGKTEDLVSSKLDLYRTLSSFCVYNVECISPELYRYTKVKGYINDKLVKNELICSWEVRNERLFMCSQEVDIARCTDLVLGSVKEVIFPICFESASIFLSSQWHDFLTKLQAESAVICNAVSSGNGTEVHVITTDDVIDYIVKKIKTFLKGMLKITTETFNCCELGTRFAELDKTDFWLARKLLDIISSEFALQYVTIENYHTFDDVPQCRITGTDEGRILAKERIRNFEL